MDFPNYEGYEADLFENSDDYRWDLIEKTIPVKNFLSNNILDSQYANVQEVACGNGRLLIALGNSYPTMNLLGTDLSHSRVEFAQKWRESLALPNVVFRQGNVLDISPYDPPDVAYEHDVTVMITGAFQYFSPLGKEQELLNYLASSTKDGGALVLELYMVPKYRRKALVANNQHSREWHQLPESDPFAYSLDDYKYYPQKEVMLHTKTFIKKDGTIDAGREEYLQYYDSDIQYLLQRSGFVVTEIYGDWDKSPHTSNSTKLIIVARRMK